MKILLPASNDSCPIPSMWNSVMVEGVKETARKRHTQIDTKWLGKFPCHPFFPIFFIFFLLVHGLKFATSFSSALDGVDFYRQTLGCP